MVELFNVSKEFKNVDDAFNYWYNCLSENASGGNRESRDGAVIGECINAVTVITDPTRCIMQNGIRKMPMRYAIGEMLWYLSGENTLDNIRKYTSAWDRMSDDGETVNSNYGWCIVDKYGFNQLDYVLQKLRDDPGTRQAVIHIKHPSDKPTNDMNCTVCLQFFVRDGKLYMTTYMRSNDLWLGFPFDVFQFTALQVWLSMKLHCELGTYTHIAGSLHLYERDYLKAEKNKEAIA